MVKARLIIVGGGGFGREILAWAQDCALAGFLPDVTGVLSDEPDALRDYSYPVTQIGSIADFHPQADDQLILALGDPAGKKKVVELLAERGGKFSSLIHPKAVLAATARVGEGSIFCPLSLASADANVGRFVTVNVMSSVGHDVRIGDYSTLSAHVDVTGFCSIESSVLVGSGAKILPKVTVGEGAIIGAGSTVYRSVAPGTTVYTPPAKPMRKSR